MSSSKKSSPLIVTVSFPSKRLALKAGNALLEAKRAASFHLVPVKSQYWWKGKIRTANEWVINLRTTSTHFKCLADEIKAIHPYELPEIIGSKIDRCSAAYLKWLNI